MKKDSFNSLQDFQNYIDTEKIPSLKSFRKEHKNVYTKYLSERKTWKIDKDLNFPSESPRFKYSNLNTISDFQKYINDNSIKSKQEFRKLKALSSRFFRVIPKEDRTKLVFLEKGKYIFGNEFSSVEDFQNFIDSHEDIQRPVDFKNNYPKLYDRLCRVISKEDKKLLKYNTRINTYESILTTDDLQTFIDNNKIHSRKELHKYFPGLYVKFANQLDRVLFKSNNYSLGENYLINLFSLNNIDFITQKTFPDLRFILPLRYDFYLPEFNILIEHQGEGHFGKGRYYSEELIKSDKMKYEYAINNNIPIFYYTIYKQDYYNCKDYFTEVITDSDILIQEIKKIGLTNQSKS